MKAILIPVKEFAQAKKRLAPHFSGADRAALAKALCADFFQVIDRVRGVDRIFVVSKETEALALARAAGWENIVESDQHSESASVDFASRQCAGQGITSLLRIPVDLPLVEPRDIEILFDSLDDSPSTVLAPSSDGTGTNALLRTPPTLFPSHFGPNSLALHLAEANALGIQPRIVRNPGLEFDIDELADLQKIAPMVPAGSNIARWFSERPQIGGFRNRPARASSLAD